ncbi:hypothetical protein HJC23_007662 [Cyclotella cryptica]|uniref:Helicase-associated domain-containing protein n=1 Tax=Cyclotella cryptica TaxID=29204 RepID=A0ABD3NSD4_9STRA|eukprot:CCRYP_020159-RA/>CCRYP_020159-RA protein AED:0.01 eAED:0.01 QI:270/-1/0/1/-1/1/1/38/248
MCMKSLRRNHFVRYLPTIFLLLPTFLICVTPAHSFNTAPQTSLQTFGRPSHCTASTLYYLDRDPVMEVAQSERLEFARESLLAEPVANVSNTTETCDSILRSARITDRSKKPIQSHTKTWNIRYHDLLEFKKEHGHCLVPQHYPPNPKLGLWVMAQRRYYKLQSRKQGINKLSLRHQHRVRLLEEVGFVFDVKRRGPRVSKIHQMSRCSQDGSNEVHAMEDFVGFVIENRYTDEEKRQAWKLRFQLFQ